MKLARSFYSRPAITVARELIGKILVRRVGTREVRARIVETEAYVGEHDLACHAAKGRTARTEVMFGMGGHAYVYLIYGIHHMLNVVCSVEGDAQAVLIRAAEPLGEWRVNLTGPGNLARGFQISRSDNRLDLTGDALFIINGCTPPPRVARTQRVGVDFSGHWKNRLLRFLDPDSPAVSHWKKSRPTKREAKSHCA